MSLRRRLFSRVDSRSLGWGSPPPLALGSRAKPYRLGRPSTKPPTLRSTVPCGFNETRTGPESSPASHRLRLWGLALGPASPCADCHGAGTLGLTVSGVFTPICAYSFRHPHFSHLHHTFPRWLQGCENAPLPRTRKCAGRASAGRLIPTILGAFPLDW